MLSLPMMLVGILLLFVLWLLLTVLLVAPGRYPKADPARLLSADGTPTPIAHRGLHDNEAGLPENSLPAFAAALAAGYGVELDLQLTADEQVVVFHDDTLLRVCGDTRRICDLRYDELQTLRLLDTDQRIPLFSEVLALMTGQQTMIIEFKGGPNKKRLCELAYEMLCAYQGPYCIESFHPDIVLWFRKHAPEVVRGQLAGGQKIYPKWWQGLAMAHSLTHLLTRPHFSAFHCPDVKGRFTLWLYQTLGGKLAAWTVTDRKTYADCQKRFDVVIFEKPDTPKG